MAEIHKRPNVRKIELSTKERGREVAKSGANLDDVLRGILCDYKEAMGISTREMALRFGLSPQTVSGYLDESRPGGKISMLSSICAALDSCPGSLFKRHPLFANAKQTGNPHLNRVPLLELDGDTLTKAEEVLELANRLGMFDVVVAQAHGMLVAMAEAQGIKIKSS